MTRIEKENIKQRLYRVLLVSFISIFICCVFILVGWDIARRKNANEIEEIRKITDAIEVEDSESTELVNPPNDKNDDYWRYINLPLLDVNLKELKEINSDIVGYISVAGTNINYPVVQAKDNDYYLEHSLRKESSKAGWVFADYRNNLENLDKNTIIYGHNRLDGTMFGTLKNILKLDWLDNKDSHVMKLSTLTENTLWQVFSVYTIPEESYYIETNFNTDKEYQNWLNTMIGRSKYNFNTSVNINDKILTLSTCYGNNNTRIVVHTKLIKRCTNETINMLDHESE